MRRHFIYSSILILIILMHAIYAFSVSWESMPIRTINQQKAGLMGGEGFQMVMDIAYTPSKPSIVYMAVDTSRVWKSTDEGNTWHYQSLGITTKGVRSIIVDPKNPDIVFAAGFGGHSVERSYSNAFSGIFRSTDGGRRWDFLKETQFFKQTRGKLFAFDASSGGRSGCSIIYAGSYNEGLLLSINGGNSWESVGFKDKHILDMEADPRVHGHLYVATEGGLFKYTADSITHIGRGLPDYPRGIAVHHQNSQIVYAAVGRWGVYKSTNGGLTFLPINQGLPASIECSNVTVSSVDSNIVYVAFNKTGIPNPYYSKNGGKTWKAPITINDDKLFHVKNTGCWYTAPIAPHPQSAEKALAVANGANIVIRTSDYGKRWRYSNTGYTGGVLGWGTSVSFGPNGKMMFCLIDFGCWLTEDGGNTFRNLKVKRALGAKTSTSGAMHENTIIVAVGTWEQQALEVSHNGGKSWKVHEELLDFHRFIAFHPQSSAVVYAGKYRSSDGGFSWELLQERIGAMYPDNGNIVYAISSAPNGKAVIKKSNDRGNSWTAPYGTSPFSADSICGIAVAPNNPDQIYAATDSGVWILNNGRWVQRTSAHGLKRDSFRLNVVKAVVVDPIRPNVVYAGKWAPGIGESNGIFRTQDGGSTWENITGNLGPDLEINSINVNPRDSSVFIGTYRGTFIFRPTFARGAVSN